MFIQTGWDIQPWTKLFFFLSMYRSSSLTETYGTLESTDWCLLGLLAVHMFNEGTMFCHDDLQVTE